MKPRLPPPRSLQASNPGPNGFVLLGPTPIPTRRWRLRLPKLRSTRVILVTLLVVSALAVAYYLRPEPTEIERLERAAFRGDAMSALDLCILYRGGKGIPRNDAISYAWFEVAGTLDPKYRKLSWIDESTSAAAKVEGQHLAIELFKKVRHSPQPDFKKDTPELAREKQRSPAATPIPAKQTPAPLTEIARLRAKAEQGDTIAQNDLGFAYARGQGVSKDESEAVKWYRKAAEQGYFVARHNLGVAYANGQGVLKDEAEAVKWYSEAADQGYAAAQFNLGLMYANGRGVTKDDAEAEKWFRRAADRGYEAAELKLRNMSALGRSFLGDSSSASAATYPVVPATKSTQQTADAKLRHLATDDRLPTGSLLVDRLRNDGGKGKLTLDNGRAEDAYVKLVRDGKTVVGFYVRSHEKVTYSTIPDGTFWVMYCTGYGWDAKVRSFARGKYARHYDLPLTYTTRRERDASVITTSTDVVTLTLHTVANGNTTTTEMSVEDFDRY